MFFKNDREGGGVVGLRGPSKKPSALNDLQGNPGKRKCNDKEFKPPIDDEVPAPPPYLGTYAKKEWKRIAPILHKANLLTKCDMTILSSYCQAYDRWLTAEKKLRTFDELTYTSDKGNILARPEVSIANKAMDDLLRYGREFGLTPSSRRNLSVDTEEETEDPFLTLVRGVKNNAG